MCRLTPSLLSCLISARWTVSNVGHVSRATCWAGLVLTLCVNAPEWTHKTWPNLQTLQQAKHDIKTGFGRSEAVYGDTPIPIRGIGQGNGLGPTLWALTSTQLLRMMEKAGHCINILTSISFMTLAMLGFIFVDDTDWLLAGKTAVVTGKDMVTEFQEVLDW